MDEAKKIKKIDRKVFLSENAIIRSIAIIGIFIIDIFLNTYIAYRGLRGFQGFDVIDVCGYIYGALIVWILSELRSEPTIDLDLSMIVSIVLLIALIMLAMFFPPTPEAIQELCDSWFGRF